MPKCKSNQEESRVPGVTRRAWLLGVLSMAFCRPWHQIFAAVPTTRRANEFFEASAILNGLRPRFENHAKPYWNLLRKQYGPDRLRKLVRLVLKYDDEERRNQAIFKADLDDVAQGVIYLWYTGSLQTGAGPEKVETYLASLAWKAYAKVYNPAEISFVSTLCGGTFGAWHEPVRRQSAQPAALTEGRRS